MMRRSASTENHRSTSKNPPPLPPRTPSMFVDLPTTRPATLPRNFSRDVPPPLPPRPGGGGGGPSNPISRDNRSTSTRSHTNIPPGLPPRPIPRSTSTPNTTMPAPPRPEYDVVPVTLGELTKELTTNIPSCIRVRELHSVHGASSSIAEGDILNLHFSKSTRVAYVQSISNMVVLVPINSPMMCSVLYDPIDDMDRAEKGYTFGSGSQLIDATPPPMFVSVVKGCSKKKPALSSFNTGEVLALKGVENGHLKCFNVSDQEIKYIHSTTSAIFTTDPQKLKVYLSEVVKHIECQIKIKFWPQNPELHHQLRKPYTLLDIGAQKSVIATYGCFKPQLGDSSGLDYIIEIFLNSPLKCEPYKLPQTDRTNMLKQSKKLFQSFKPSSVKEIVADIPSAIRMCQTLLFLSVEQVHGSVSRNQPVLHNASITGQMARFTPMPVPTNNNPIDPRYSQSATMRHNPPASIGADGTIAAQPAPPLPPKPITSNPSPTMVSPASRFPPVIEEDPYSLSPGNLYQIDNDQPNDDDGSYDDIYDDFGGKEKPINMLTINEVLLVLEGIGLEQYCRKFEQERINGAILVQLDEDMLERDFGMTSRLHRMKIMNVIQGRQSIRAFLP